MSQAVETTATEAGSVLVEPKVALRPATPALRNERGRIAAVDALRGLAAVAVVLYHYTYRYGGLSAAYPEQYPMVGKPPFEVPWGHFGVQLFFMISGFVILMTVMKVKSVWEFALLRLVRLYPAFWVACGVTLAVTHTWGLPLRTVGSPDAAVNMTMLPGAFNARYIDAVYWTLQQEMMFCVVMAVMMALGLRRYAIWAVAGLVVASLCGVGELGWHAGPKLVAIVNLHWFSLFLLGMVLYDAKERGARWWHAGLVLVCAADVLNERVWSNGSADWLAIWAIGISFALLAVATRWRIVLPGERVLLYFGTLSYCLYLVHQNIGYVVMRGLYLRGVPANAAIALAICVAVAIATAITYGVERPACAWGRRFVKGRMAKGGRREAVSV